MTTATELIDQLTEAGMSQADLKDVLKLLKNANAPEPKSSSLMAKSKGGPKEVKLSYSKGPDAKKAMRILGKEGYKTFLHRIGGNIVSVWKA